MDTCKVLTSFFLRIQPGQSVISQLQFLEIGNEMQEVDDEAGLFVKELLLLFLLLLKFALLLLLFLLCWGRSVLFLLLAVVVVGVGC